MAMQGGAARIEQLMGEQVSDHDVFFALGMSAIAEADADTRFFLSHMGPGFPYHVADRREDGHERRLRQEPVTEERRVGDRRAEPTPPVV